jgi:hypothetical protein
MRAGAAMRYVVALERRFLDSADRFELTETLREQLGALRRLVRLDLYPQSTGCRDSGAKPCWARFRAPNA